MTGILQEWVAGAANSFTQKGALLLTRDGRRCGNAVQLGSDPEWNERPSCTSPPVYHVVTDAGVSYHFGLRELKSLFFKPSRLIRLDLHPGVIAYRRRKAVEG